MDTITLIESKKKDYFAVAYHGKYYRCKTKKKLLEIASQCVYSKPPNQEVADSQAESCGFHACETPYLKPGCYGDCIYYTPAAEL